MKKFLFAIVLLSALPVWSCENCEVPPWLVVKPAEGDDDAADA